MNTVLLAVVTVLIAIALSLGAERVARPYNPPGDEIPGASDLVNGLFAFYGILLSLVLVGVWDDYQRAREITVAEATATADLARAIEVLPPPLGPAVAREAVEYYELVLSDELPAMNHGGASPAVSAKLDAVWKHVTAFNPADERQRGLLDIALSRIAEVSNQRRLRLVANERRLPQLLWGVIFLGGVSGIGLSPLLTVRNWRMALLRAATAGLVGLIVFTIYALEFPFRSPVRIDASDILRVRTLINPSAR